MTAGPIFLANGYAGPDAFPGPVLAVCAAEVLREQPDVALQYGPVQGLPSLRALIAGWLRADGLTWVRDDDVVVAPGGKQALSLAARAFAPHGGTVLTSSPTYMTGLGIFRSQGLHTSGVPTDDEGLCTDILDGRLAAADRPAAAVLYTMSDFHNPTGTVLSAQRRGDLADIAQRHELVVVEDNPYRWLRFEGTPAPPLGASRPDAPIVSIGSFSKILAPGLRLAWMTVPPSLRDRMQAFGLELAASPLTQLLVQRFFERVPLEDHLAHTTALYRSKRDAAIAALEATMPEGVTWNRPAGGYYVWLRVEDVDTDALTDVAQAAGVVVYPGSAFFPDDAPRTVTHVRINYARESVGRIAQGIAVVARAIADLRRR